MSYPFTLRDRALIVVVAAVGPVAADEHRAGQKPACGLLHP